MKPSQRIREGLVASAVLILLATGAAYGQTLQAVSASSETTPLRSTDQARPNAIATPQATSHHADAAGAKARHPMTEMEMLSGLPLDAEQKAAIEQIHQAMKTKMEIVARDNNESPEQKSAMLEGLQRMQLTQVFAVLTRAQREDVRKRVLATRPAPRANAPTPRTVPSR